MCSFIWVGERLHKVFGQIDLGTLDSGERSLPFGLLVTVISHNAGVKSLLAMAAARCNGQFFHTPPPTSFSQGKDRAGPFLPPGKKLTTQSSGEKK